MGPLFYPAFLILLVFYRAAASREYKIVVSPPNLSETEVEGRLTQMAMRDPVSADAVVHIAEMGLSEFQEFVSVLSEVRSYRNLNSLQILVNRIRKEREIN